MYTFETKGENEPKIHKQGDILIKRVPKINIGWWREMQIWN